MNRCKTCKYWNNRGKGKSGHCKKILPMWKIFRENKEVNVLIDDGDMALVITNNDFGCVNHKLK